MADRCIRKILHGYADFVENNFQLPGQLARQIAEDDEKKDLECLRKGYAAAEEAGVLPYANMPAIRDMLIEDRASFEEDLAESGHVAIEEETLSKSLQQCDL